MQGTVNAIARVYDSRGVLALQTQVGDRVEYLSGAGSTLSITKLTRNGVVKLDGGIWYLQSVFVTPDTVSPPPVDPPPSGIFLKHVIEVYSDGSIKVDGVSYS